MKSEKRISNYKSETALELSESFRTALDKYTLAKLMPIDRAYTPFLGLKATTMEHGL